MMDLFDCITYVSHVKTQLDLHAHTLKTTADWAKVAQQYAADQKAFQKNEDFKGSVGHVLECAEGCLASLGTASDDVDELLTALNQLIA